MLHCFRRLPIFASVATLLIVCWLAPASLIAQDVEADTTQQTLTGLRVYLDCDECDFDHVRSEIAYVNYVRDPEQADVHLFITDQRTGSNGRLYELSFLGRGDYASIEYTFEQTVDGNATNDEMRQAINEAIRLGLVPYVVQTEPLSDFQLQYTGMPQAADAEPPNDPWKYWVFTAYVGSIELELESNRTVFDSRWGLFADHVTDDWKLRIRPYFNYDLVKIKREGNPDVRSSISRHGLESYAIRSLGPHWSVGVFGDYLTRNDQNIRNEYELMPGVEYSILPYEEATRREITVTYQLGLTYVDYFEETIFNQTEEALARQELSLSVAIQQPWGEVFGSLEGSHYFHDFTKRRAELFGFISVRLFEGLSIRVRGDIEMVQDQLNLPLGDASIEEILLQQRELATDFEFSGSVALTYRFGSQFANIVNTRF